MSKAEPTIDTLARLLQSTHADAPRAAARVLEVCADLVAANGDPSTWLPAAESDDPGVSELVAAARQLVRLLEQRGITEWCAQLPVSGGSLSALVSLAGEVAAVGARSSRAVRGRGPARGVTTGVRAFFALIVELLEREGLVRSASPRSSFVRAADAVAVHFGIAISVRRFLRGSTNPNVALMPLPLAITHLRRGDRRRSFGIPPSPAHAGNASGVAPQQAVGLTAI